MNRLRSTTLALTFALAALGLGASGAAAGGDDNGGGGGDDDEIRNAGLCSDSSSSKIKVKTDDGRLEVEFEVDQNVNGEKWKVKFKNGNDVVFKGTATTRAPSGSFSIERKIADGPGSDRIKAVARNKSSDERCSATATI
jgi:hypothetical protein